ncbi:MAG: hypothetical protein HWN66_00560 [Candidatus Helarchaeota archaeon]|nr:hypothetical protein [Candidatus Helarchaeota archaeon]
MDRRKEKFKELDEIEKAAGNLLEELAQLESLPDSTSTQDNYLNIIKEMQNQMKETILKGIRLNDRDVFLKGLEFYKKNYTILSTIGDRRVCEDYQHEMIQILTDLIVHFKKEINNPLRRYFIIISLQFIAKIYEDAQNFSRAIEIRLTVSNLLKSWAGALEYSAIVLDYLLNDEIARAQEFLKQFVLLESKIYLLNINIIEQSIQSKRLFYLKEFSEAVITGTSKDLPIFFEDAKEYLDKLDLSDNFELKRIYTLFSIYMKKIGQAPLVEEVLEEIPIESPTTEPSETQLLTSIKKVVLESIKSQQIPKTKPSSAPVINTSAIMTELKEFISNSIKTLSQEIISNVSKYTLAVPQTQRPRSSHILDDNIPEISVVSPTASGEKPQRPKLADVLDSIIVSE